MAASTIADEPTRRDFLFVATGAMGVAAAGFVAWPLIANARGQLRLQILNNWPLGH